MRSMTSRNLIKVCALSVVSVERTFFRKSPRYFSPESRMARLLFPLFQIRSWPDPPQGCSFQPSGNRRSSWPSQHRSSRQSSRMWWRSRSRPWNFRPGKIEDVDNSISSSRQIREGAIGWHIAQPFWRFVEGYFFWSYLSSNWNIMIRTTNFPFLISSPETLPTGWRDLVQLIILCTWPILLGGSIAASSEDSFAWLSPEGSGNGRNYL